MKLIEILSDHISEEIEDAHEYAEMAIEYRETYPSLAQTLFSLSQEEMNHMARLHEQVSAIIKDYRAKVGEPPEAMLAVYEYLHRKQIAAAESVKNMQSLYK